MLHKIKKWLKFQPRIDVVTNGEFTKISFWLIVKIIIVLFFTYFLLYPDYLNFIISDKPFTNWPGRYQIFTGIIIWVLRKPISIIILYLLGFQLQAFFRCFLKPSNNPQKTNASAGNTQLIWRFEKFERLGIFIKLMSNLLELKLAEFWPHPDYKTSGERTLEKINNNIERQNDVFNKIENKIDIDLSQFNADYIFLIYNQIKPLAGDTSLMCDILKYNNKFHIYEPVTNIFGTVQNICNHIEKNNINSYKIIDKRYN